MAHKRIRVINVRGLLCHVERAANRSVHAPMLYWTEWGEIKEEGGWEIERERERERERESEFARNGETIGAKAMDAKGKKGHETRVQSLKRNEEWKD
jgi:hypothetical protein